jgi:hypothetical protein
MTTATATVPRQSQADHANLRLVQVALVVGSIALIAFAVVGTFFATISEGDFRYTADYWYTGAGVPIALAGIGIAVGFHRLQHGADGRLGTVGVWVNTLALAELTVQLLASVAAGAELRWGPMYVVCSLLTLVGVALLAAGSWHNELLPRWVLGVWPVIWLLGSFAAGGLMPLLLVAFFALYGVMLSRRVRARTA